MAICIQNRDGLLAFSTGATPGKNVYGEWVSSPYTYNKNQ